MSEQKVEAGIEPPTEYTCPGVFELGLRIGMLIERINIIKEREYDRLQGLLNRWHQCINEVAKDKPIPDISLIDVAAFFAANILVEISETSGKRDDSILKHPYEWYTLFTTLVSMHMKHIKQVKDEKQKGKYTKNHLWV